MSIIGKWGYSTNEETYSGFFDSREEAIAAVQSVYDGDDRLVWVGQFREPICEQAIHGRDLIEQVVCQDEYCGDWADDAISATNEEIDELTQAIRKVFGEWMDKYGLRPSFGVVDIAEKINLIGPMND